MSSRFLSRSFNDAPSIRRPLQFTYFVTIIRRSGYFQDQLADRLGCISLNFLSLSSTPNPGPFSRSGWPAFYLAAYFFGHISIFSFCFRLSVDIQDQAGDLVMRSFHFHA